MNTTVSCLHRIGLAAFGLLCGCLISFLAFKCGAETDARVLHSFTEYSALNDTNYDGWSPIGRPVLVGTNLYGTAMYGGTSGQGTLFRVSVDGNRFTNMHNFGGPQDGAFPQAGLTVSGNKLYGTSSSGPVNNSGGIFSINSDGTGYVNLYIFTPMAFDPSKGTGTNRDGGGLFGGVVAAGGMLYGDTSAGGKFGSGTIFAVRTNGTGFTNLYNFSLVTTRSNTNSDGTDPRAGLILSGGTLYGVTTDGGSNGNGTIFSISTNGTGFTVLHHFGDVPGDGGQPHGDLLLADNVLYGTTSFYGSYTNGTVFKINTDGSGYRTLHEFSREFSSDIYDETNWDGGDPVSTLILSRGTLVGAARSFGIHGTGTIFSLGTNGDNFAIIHQVSAMHEPDETNLEGTYPNSGVIISGDTLYGVAPLGGANDSGTVFALKLPSPPVLNIARANTNVVVSWPTAAVGYQLRSTTNLPFGNWSDVPDPLTVVDTNFVFTGSVTGPPTFFRLQR